MQFLVAAAVAVRRRVGDILPRVRPLDVVALAAHQHDKFLTRPGVLHTLVDHTHEPELPALAFCRDMVLADGHRLDLRLSLLLLLFLLRREHRQTKLHTDHVVARPQLLKLLIRHVKFPARLEVDRVDDAVRVDMLSVGVRADQHLTVLEVSGELDCGGVRDLRIDVSALREALHHVVEHHTVLLAVELLRAHEVIVDGFGAAVDPGDQTLSVERYLVLALGVLHHRRHARAVLTALVVAERHDCHVRLTSHARPRRRPPRRSSRARARRRRDSRP